MSILITIIIFGIIVIIHEWGHFFVAKKSGVYVEEFAVGMGPKLFGIQRGDTLYTLRLLPLGGFCRMADFTDEENGIIGFNDVNVFKRMAICIAGPFMNFVLALIVMAGISSVTAISDCRIAVFVDNSPAQQAGLQIGDRIVKVNNSKIHILDELNYIMADLSGESVEITVKRGSEEIVKNITPMYSQKDNRYLIGVSTGVKAPLFDVGLYDDIPADMQKATIGETIYDGYWNGIFIVKATFDGLIKIFTNDVSVGELSGPIGVTTVVDDTYKETKSVGVLAVIITMANITALLSANLGILNLLPIPALDGGKLLIYVVEIVRRKQIPPEKEGIINLAGFALLMALAIFVAFNDIGKLIK